MVAPQCSTCPPGSVAADGGDAAKFMPETIEEWLSLPDKVDSNESNVLVDVENVVDDICHLTTDDGGIVNRQDGLAACAAADGGNYELSDLVSVSSTSRTEPVDQELANNETLPRGI